MYVNTDGYFWSPLFKKKKNVFSNELKGKKK